jgi:hypothetical protein
MTLTKDRHRAKRCVVLKIGKGRGGKEGELASGATLFYSRSSADDIGSERLEQSDRNLELLVSRLKRGSRETERTRQWWRQGIRTEEGARQNHSRGRLDRSLLPCGAKG